MHRWVLDVDHKVVEVSWSWDCTRLASELAEATKDIGGAKKLIVKAKSIYVEFSTKDEAELFARAVPDFIVNWIPR
jgi:hypothetical protein